MNMKKTLALLAIFFSAMLTTQVSLAGPNHDHGRGGDRGYNKRFNDSQRDDDDLREHRKEREERGFQRLQQHRWQTGYVMPQHYRGNSYKVDYKNNNLPKPGRNQQWYKINNDFILIDQGNNSIVSIREL